MSTVQNKTTCLGANAAVDGGWSVDGGWGVDWGWGIGWLGGFIGKSLTLVPDISNVTGVGISHGVGNNLKVKIIFCNNLKV